MRPAVLLEFPVTPAPSPPVKRIPELIHRAAERWGDRPFLERGGAASAVGFRGASEFVRRAAAKLAALGVRPAEPVVIQGANAPEWGIAYLAVLEAGAVATPLDPQLHDADAGAILAACRARIALADTSHAAGLARVAGAQGMALQVVPLESMTAQGGDEALAFAPSATRTDVRAREESAAPSPTVGEGGIPPPTGGSDDVAALIFTSGTTGRPKGVLLTHANLLHNVEAIVRAFHFDHRDRFLSVLPLHHAFECTAGFLSPLRAGARVAYARSLKSAELREDLHTSRATILLGVPLLFEKLEAAMTRGVAAAPGARGAAAGAWLATARALRRVLGLRAARAVAVPLRVRAGLGSLRALVSGASALRPELFDAFADWGLPLVEGYGLTECAPVVAVNRPERARSGGVGWPLPGVAVRLVDADAAGEGEIAVRGPNVMLGYFGDPAATAEMIRDGWLHTGDLGRMLPDGRLRITGRRKNLIVTAAGKKIYPEELEARLGRSRYVLEVLVVPGHGPHGAREEVHAHVVPAREAIEALARERGRQADEAFVQAVLNEEIEALCRDLAPFKRVRRVVVRRGPFERTGTGKIRRDRITAG